MILDLTAVRVRLHSADDEILSGWRRCCAPWLHFEPGPTATDADFSLSLRQTITPPTAPQIFHDEALALSLFGDVAERVWLHFHDGALVSVPLAAQPTIRGEITAALLQNGRLHDVTFTALAPILRRRGIFLVHAFAAAKNGRCLLLVGPTGSGKTTAGVTLLQQGWRLLGNDVVMLQVRADGVYALPTPGPLNVRPSTRRLLSLPPQIAFEWQRPLPVTTLCFPHIRPDAPCALRPLSASVALARLAAESVDRWDTPLLAAHLTCLQKVVAQTAVYALQSGHDVADWPALLPD